MMSWRNACAASPLRRTRIVFATIVCLGTATVTSFAEAAPLNNARAVIDVELRDGLLTLNASNAPLIEVIRAIGGEAGFQTVVHGELNDVLTSSFRAIPLDQALRRILKDVSNMMRFEGSQDPRLTQVLLYGDVVSGSTSAVLTVETPEAPVIVGAPDTERTAFVTATHERARAGDPQALEELTRLLRENTDPTVRSEAAGALGKIGDAATVSALQIGAQDNEQPVRIRSIRALAAIKNDQSTQVLADLLFNHPDTRTRLLAVWALGEHDSPLARSYLEAAKADGDALIQQAASRAGPAIGDNIEPGGDTAAPE